MKNFLFTFLLSSMGLLSATAQVHLKGQRFIDVQAGLTDGLRPGSGQLGLNAVVSTGQYNRHYNVWKLTFSFTQKPVRVAYKVDAIPVQQYAVGWGYEFNLWRNPVRTRFVRATIQPTAFYESVRPNFDPLPDSSAIQTNLNSRFMLGADIGVEVELSPVVFSIRQRWHPKSSVQPFHTMLNIGWRFHR